MICKRCGKEIPNGSDFCLFCGLTVEKNSQQQYAPNNAYQQGANQPYQNMNSQPQYNNYGAPQQYNPAYQGPVNTDPAMAAKNVTFGEAVKGLFKNYANFKGRASKSEFWFTYLAVFLANMVISTGLGTIIGLIVGITGNEELVFLSFLTYIPAIALFIPMLAAAVRRFHDIGYPGTRYFMALIPFAGFIIFLIDMCKESDPNDNQWGPAARNNFNSNQYQNNYGGYNNGGNYNPDNNFGNNNFSGNNFNNNNYNNSNNW